MSAAAIYARFRPICSERRRSKQDRICRERATREGLPVYDYYSDRGISGASLVRPGIQKLLRDALGGRFESSSPSSSTGCPANGKISRIFSSGSVCRRPDRHRLGGRNQRTPHRPERHDGGAPISRILRTGPPRPARPRRSRKIRRREQLRLRGRARRRPDGQPLTGNAGSMRSRRRWSAAFSKNTPPASRRARSPSPECRGRTRPVGRERGASPVTATASAAPASSTMSLYRPAGLEPLALRQGPGNRQAGVPAQS